MIGKLFGGYLGTATRPLQYLFAQVHLQQESKIQFVFIFKDTSFVNRSHRVDSSIMPEVSLNAVIDINKLRNI